MYYVVFNLHVVEVYFLAIMREVDISWLGIEVLDLLIYRIVIFVAIDLLL